MRLRSAASVIFDLLRNRTRGAQHRVLGIQRFPGRPLQRPNRPGPQIDSSGQLLSGETFQSITDFKQVLLESHRDEFARCLTSKLLLYASGRTLAPGDEAEIARIAEEPVGLRDLVMAIVESEAFRSN